MDVKYNVLRDTKYRNYSLNQLEEINYKNLKENTLNKLSSNLKEEFLFYVDQYEKSYSFPRKMPWNDRTD